MNLLHRLFTLRTEGMEEIKQQVLDTFEINYEKSYMGKDTEDITGI
jgi:hypothetical protein